MPTEVIWSRAENKFDLLGTKEVTKMEEEFTETIATEVVGAGAGLPFGTGFVVRKGLSAMSSDDEDDS